MIRTLAAFYLALCFGVASAEPARDLVLARPNDPSPTTLPLHDGVAIIECDREAILNFYCLRADIAQERAILSDFSDGILRQGWTMLGEDTETRPFTYIFQRPQPGVDCPLLIMITSNTSTQGTRPPLPAGVVEVQLAQTADITCLFD
ncbi:MAG: hypothetical protein M0D54_00460 [Hyphomonadaceae bacterium JAD_PAG50586_4]|nr:MAG: hypothetical protein M0D54_00460 [Hyphomonadaceae bacterium JAD_PAG50586_4]